MTRQPLRTFDELLIRADQLWQQAEACVADDPEVLRRVKLSRMSVDYAILERARLQAAKKLPANAALRTLAAARFGPFIEVLNSSSLTRIREWTSLDKNDYRRGLAEALELKQDE